MHMFSKPSIPSSFSAKPIYLEDVFFNRQTIYTRLGKAQIIPDKRKICKIRYISTTYVYFSHSKLVGLGTVGATNIFAINAFE